MDTSEKIKQIRNANHITQLELAEKIGVNVQTVRSYEAGKYRPKDDTLQKIAQVFGIHPSLLLPDWQIPPDSVNSSELKKESNNSTALYDWLIANGIELEDKIINGKAGKIITVDSFSGFLTSEQLSSLPDMSIEQIKALIRSMAKMNENT